jgi:hypothetical protein
VCSVLDDARTPWSTSTPALLMARMVYAKRTAHASMETHTVLVLMYMVSTRRVAALCLAMST